LICPRVFRETLSAEVARNILLLPDDVENARTTRELKDIIVTNAVRAANILQEGVIMWID
jgi:hypothetical protein